MKTESTAPAPKPEKKRRPLWLRILKWCGITIASLILILIIAVGTAVWILTPERLTPLVEKYGTEYINGRVELKRAELTFWKTFPKLQVDVDSLRIISHSLHSLPGPQRAALPANADSLLSLERFSGGINILELLRGRIALYDVDVVRPAVNVVQATPELSNFDIFPPSEPDTTAVTIPDLSFKRLAIRGEAPISYVSIPDTLSASLSISEITADGKDRPAYTLHYSSTADVEAGGITLNNLLLGANGSIIWKHDHPYKVELKDFGIGLNTIHATLSAVADFEKDLTVESMNLIVPDIPLTDAIALIPKEMQGELANVKTDMTPTLTATLTSPYVPARDELPSAHVTLRVPDCSLSYEQLDIKKLALEAEAEVNGQNPDLSTLTLSRLIAIGQGVGFELDATVSNPVSDPLVAGNFKGGIEFARLPKKLTQQYGVTLAGSLHADAGFRLRKSWLDRTNFHRINAAGKLDLRNFSLSMPMMSVDCYVRNINFEFGTTQSFVRGDHAADSLLTASIKIDTIAAAVPGMTANGSAIRVGVGCKNTASSADTTQLNPIGAVMAIGRFKMLDTSDSTRYTVRDVKARASVKRFRDSKREPLLNLDIDARRLRYADRVNRANLRESHVALTLHPSVRKAGRRSHARLDSLRRLYPDLPDDSLKAIARRMRSHRSAGTFSAPEGSTQMDYGLDSETQSLLRKWRAQGSLKAKRARVFTPYFPLRNILTDIDLTFNNDSVIVSNTRYKVGQSSFLIDGSITNITRALTSRSGRQPLRLNFRITADTINVNQIAAATFAGAAFAEKERQGFMAAIADSDDDNIIQQSIAAQADSTEAGPLLIPTNIEATLRLNARNVIYSDFTFNNFRGMVEIADGILNMRNLSARSNVGSIDLTAMYDGIDPADLSFAFGMNLRDFRIRRFLDLVPSLDTIMPLLADMEGTVNAQMAAQTRLDSEMNLNIPSLNAALTIKGDSLVLLDAETFRKVGKWLLFKNKNRNVIDSMEAKLVVKNSTMQLYPFLFNIDRYRLGVYGHNDMDLNFNYHVAVLKSPIPFRFGINVRGNADKMRVRLGGPKWDEKSAMKSFVIADTARVNLVNQIQALFRRGVRISREKANLNFDNSPARVTMDTEAGADTISHADSLLFIQEGLLPAPPPPAEPAAPVKSNKKKKRR